MNPSLAIVKYEIILLSRCDSSNKRDAVLPIPRVDDSPLGQSFNYPRKWQPDHVDQRFLAVTIRRH